MAKESDVERGRRRSASLSAVSGTAQQGNASNQPFAPASNCNSDSTSTSTSASPSSSPTSSSTPAPSVLFSTLPSKPTSASHMDAALRFAAADAAAAAGGGGDHGHTGGQTSGIWSDDAEDGTSSRKLFTVRGHHRFGFVSAILEVLNGRWWRYHVSAADKSQQLHGFRPRQPTWLYSLALALAVAVSYLAFCSEGTFVSLFPTVVLLPQSVVTRLFLAWVAMSIVGVAFVNYVVCARDHPLRGRHKNYSDFLVVLVLTPVTFWFTLMPYLDEHAPWSKQGIGGVEDAFVVRPGRAVFVPGLWAALGYYAGLHYVYLAGRFKTFATSLSAHDLQNRSDNRILASMAWKGTIVLSLFSLHLFWCSTIGFDFLVARITLYGAVVTALWLITSALRDRWYLHVHHYFLGVVFLPLCHFPSACFSMFVGCYCSAQFIEGATRWSAAPMWHPKKTL